VERRDAQNALQRLVWAVLVAVALVVGAVASPSTVSASDGERTGTLRARVDVHKQRTLETRPHVDPPGTAPPHNHKDPRTKNLISRSGETGADVRDPSTFLTRARARSAVAAERRMKDPRLTATRRCVVRCLPCRA
jgi:hypothetical protein